MFHDDRKAVARWTEAFAARGHEVHRAFKAEVAMTYLRDLRFELLIFDLLVDGGSGLAVALTAEFHQPEIASILVAGPSGSAMDKSFHAETLFSRLSTLRYVMGSETPASDMVAIAEAFITESGKNCYELARKTKEICIGCDFLTDCAQVESEARARADVEQIAQEPSFAGRRVASFGETGPVFVSKRSDQ